MKKDKQKEGDKDKKQRYNKDDSKKHRRRPLRKARRNRKKNDREKTTKDENLRSEGNWIAAKERKQKESEKKKRRQRFPPYLSEDDILACKFILRGHIRVNPYKRCEAYVTVPGLEEDVKVYSQNRAIEGDLVAVSLCTFDKWESLAKKREDFDSVSEEEEIHSAVENIKEEDCEDEASESGDAGNEIDDSDEESVSGDETVTLAGYIEDLQLEEVQEEPITQEIPLKADWTIEQLGQCIEQHQKRPVGEVVSIIEFSPQREHIICCIRDFPECDEEENLEIEKIVLRPLDLKYPLLLVDLRGSNRKQIQKVLFESKNKFLVSRLTRWPDHCGMPFGRIVDTLGEMTDMRNQITSILVQNGIQQSHSHEFPEEVLSCLPDTPWSIDEEEISKRRDLRDWRIFSIDPESARDLDDALSIELVSANVVKIGVHIADVAHFVKAGTALDEEACKRATSVYMPEGVLPMLPRLLCEQLCSLNPGTDRLAFSIVWHIELDSCKIVDQWIGRTIIRSCTKLNYDQAQEIIQGQEITSPLKVEKYSIDDLKKDVQLLDTIAKGMRAQRFEQGALTLNVPRLSVKMDEDGNPVGVQQYVQKDSNFLVEEFMLLANKCIAKFIADGIPSAALLRRHPAPQKRKLKTLNENLEEMQTEMNTHSSSGIQESLSRLKSEVEEHLFYAIVLMATKPMQNAIYFCTGDDLYLYKGHQDRWKHYALSFSHYTHFTSPIRRYPDILVHRMASDLLSKQQGRKAKEEKYFECTGNKRSPWSKKFTRQVAENCEHCNKQKLAAKSVQEASTKLYMSLWLQTNLLETTAVIIDVNGPQWMDLFAIDLGIDYRIYYQDDDRISTKWISESKCVLVFLGDVDEGTPHLTLKNLQPVQICLQSIYDERKGRLESFARLVL